MESEETNEERVKRFKAMPSEERKALIRKKMSSEGLQEGSGAPGKSLSSYDRDEIWDLIQVTSFLSEMQAKPKTSQKKVHNRKKSLISWMLFVITLTSGMILYYQQYPLPETRRELAVDGMFAD